MADPAQLALLTSSVAAWNTWRSENKVAVTDVDLDAAGLVAGVDLPKFHYPPVYLQRAALGGAKLDGANLIDADLRSADLTGASLNKSDLRRADLRAARLSSAALKDAILIGASLDDALFHDADFGHADLSDATLTGSAGRSVDFRRVHMSGADLGGATLYESDFRGSILSGANLSGARLDRADLREVGLDGANLYRADLRKVRLQDSSLKRARLQEADLTEADLTDTDLTAAVLVDTNLSDATLVGCNVYGIAAWNVSVEGATQSRLVVTAFDEPTITVDDLEIAQFVYLLLNNRNVRRVIDTVTSKAVLILGRFTEDRKIILDALHTALRNRGYVPILFDFDAPVSRDLTETVSTLAHMSKFILADISDPNSIPQELTTIIPNLPSVPVQPLLEGTVEPYGMFEHWARYPWVRPIHRYWGGGEVDAIITEILSAVEAGLGSSH